MNYLMNLNMSTTSDLRIAKSTWRIPQIASWTGGLILLLMLFLYPDLGLTFFWNLLIPVAPLLFLISPGTWRNICPMAITNLLPRHLGLSAKNKLSANQISVLNLIGLIALYLIVPLRHALFNFSGSATGILIITMVVIGITLGTFYEWKSAWCSGLCPVYPVEKLYGSDVLVSVSNAHCGSCANCVVPCPDSTPNVHPLQVKKNSIQKINGYMITGGFPGFIWGWFQVPDNLSLNSIHNLLEIYLYPMSGMIISLFCFILLKKLLKQRHEKKIIGTFAALSISTYYWYRIPALLGFSGFVSERPLIDLSGSLNPIWLNFSGLLFALFFFYHLVFRKQRKNSWSTRPIFEKLSKTK